MSYKSARESAKLTQQEVADALGIQRTTVAMWETGKSMPQASKLPQIAKILGCTVDELFEKQK